jgi:hypothetical protein
MADTQFTRDLPNLSSFQTTTASKHRIETPQPGIGHEPVQFRPARLRAAPALIDELVRDLPSAPGDILAKLA